MVPRAPIERECDVLVIGAGVVGCAIARELTRRDLAVHVVEAEEDVCCGASKANSGIVHAGFDARPGTLMARLNVQGAALMPGLCAELDVPYRNNGSLVLCFDDEGRAGLERLLAQGLRNGVRDLSIVGGDEARAIEPTVSPEVRWALWAPTAGIVDPFLLTVALAENAAENGAEFSFNERVAAAEPARGGWLVTTSAGSWRAGAVVNAAGLDSARLFNATVGDAAPRLSITPRRGSYYLLDKTAAPVPSVTLFQLPTDKGKGVLVAPTCHGNTLVGPTAVDVEDPLATETTAAELADVAEKAVRSVPDLPLRSVITSFAGLRAHEAGHEFVIRESAPGFFNAAGIESPGLTSAPAIGVMVADAVSRALCATQRGDFQGERLGVPRFADLPGEEQASLVAERPSYGHVVCRCELVTQGEIEDACRRPVPPRTLDGVKRRLRAGMGRCQGGFCTPFVMQVLERELGLAPSEVHKSGARSWIVDGPTKTGAGDPAAKGGER